MAGTINIALTQQFNMDGVPLSGGRLFTFQAASTTPQSTFQDEALTLVNPNPITLDASGRIPMFYVSDGHIKIRLEDKNGVVVIAADNILVVGASVAAAPPVPVDPTKILQTGDIKAAFSTGTLTGFVRCNGNTIGNTGSGATELASTTLARDLFLFLWPNTTLPIQTSSGAVTTRGISAADDFDNQNKRLSLPDLRGRTMAGLDDMGAVAAGRLTASFWGVGPDGITPTTPATILGNAAGDEKHKLTTSTQLPTFTPGGTVGVTISDHSYTPAGTVSTSGGASAGNNSAISGSVPVWMGTDGVGGALSQGIGALTSTFSGTAATISHTVSSATFTGTQINPSGATNFASATPSMVLTFYIKL